MFCVILFCEMQCNFPAWQYKSTWHTELNLGNIDALSQSSFFRGRAKLPKWGVRARFAGTGHLDEDFPSLIQLGLNPRPSWCLVWSEIDQFQPTLGKGHRLVVEQRFGFKVVLVSIQVKGSPWRRMQKAVARRDRGEMLPVSVDGVELGGFMCLSVQECCFPLHPIHYGGEIGGFPTCSECCLEYGLQYPNTATTYTESLSQNLRASPL